MGCPGSPKQRKVGYFDKGLCSKITTGADRHLCHCFGICLKRVLRLSSTTNGFCSAIKTSVRHGDVPMGMNSRKSPNDRMAMTAPGMGLFCGTASWIKTFFSLSKYIGLDETSINLRPLFVRNGKNSAGAFTQGQSAAFSSGSRSIPTSIES